MPQPGNTTTADNPALSVLRLSRAIADRETTPLEIVRTLLARIEERDGRLQAWAHVAREQAEQAAANASREIAAGKSLGPLHGIPFGIKDIFDTAGMPTGWGSPLYADRIPAADAVLVARLKDAGAIALGKTHTTGFAYFDAAPTRNPHHPEYTPGGSSSGSAAAVADGMVPFALGSQTLGSVLRPASFCGVVGLKPSFGALPLGGVLPFAPSLDHAGLFTRTVEEMAWLWCAITPGDAPKIGADRRLARPRWPIVGQLEPEMAAGFDQALARLAQIGFEIDELNLPETFSRLPEAILTVFRYEGAQTHRDRLREYGSQIGEKLAVLVEEGLRIDPKLYENSLAHLAQARREYAELAERFPVWLTPAALGAAPKGLASTGDPRANAPFTALGVPAISLPFGRDRSGLPLGLQLTAASGRESALLATALECENALRRSEATS
jgi:Asp-tRNA(Asn)/Glu-tRNA(Gln) amidotransferase A subunit family amidase